MWLKDPMSLGACVIEIFILGRWYGQSDGWSVLSTRDWSEVRSERLSGGL